MRFDLTAEQRLLQSSTAEFLEKSCPVSVARAWHDAGQAFDRETWRRGAELGWTSLIVPEKLGGGSVSGEGLVDATIIAEQLRRLAAPRPFLVVNVVVAALAEATTPDGHADLIHPHLAREAIDNRWCCS